MTLTTVPGSFAVCQLPPDMETTQCFAVVRAADETSIVCLESEAPPNSKVEAGWAMLKLQGPFEFHLTGVLLEILKPLAEANIGIFAISTYNTDYVLVKNTDLKAAIDVLEKYGHSVLGG